MNASSPGYLSLFFGLFFTARFYYLSFILSPPYCYIIIQPLSLIQPPLPPRRVSHLNVDGRSSRSWEPQAPLFSTTEALHTPLIRHEATTTTLCLTPYSNCRSILLRPVCLSSSLVPLRQHEPARRLKPRTFQNYLYRVDRSSISSAPPFYLSIKIRRNLSATPRAFAFYCLIFITVDPDN